MSQATSSVMHHSLQAAVPPAASFKAKCSAPWTCNVQAARCYLLGRLKDEERPALLFNTVISSCLHYNRLDLANQLFRAMEKAAVQRDAVSWNLALRAQVSRSSMDF